MDMLTHMRTTIDLPDALLAKAKRVARARGIALRELTIQALSALLGQGEPRAPFRLRDASFGKQGLVKGLSETD
jgi:Arc/MetJ family transcription regulator